MEQFRELFAGHVAGGVTGKVHDGLERLFERVRPYLPRRRRVRYNTVEVNVFERPLDRLFPSASWRARDQPQYDSGLVDGVRSSVTEGDVVVVVGGGFGVTTVAAARRVGESGTVLTYEAATERVRDVRKAVEYEGLSDRVSVLHASVEQVVHALGEVGDAPRVPARTLPPCDVLVVDCDGPETTVLRNLTVEPRVVVANTAARFGSAERGVRNALSDRGYRVVSREVASEESREFCHEHGYYALTAVRGDHERTPERTVEAVADQPSERGASRSQ